jgi:hypothetical protein
VLLLSVLVVGIGGRALYVDRPLDVRSLAAWREADYTQIARNFYRDSLNLFYPQIDWRRDTPGYAEMELPLIPWVGALLYRLFGYHEAVLRVLSAIFSTVGLLLFVALSRQVLPPLGVVFATAAFAFNPLLVYLAGAMQPEPLMLCLALLAVLLIWQWEDQPSFARLLAAAGVTAAAILTKSTAAFLGAILTYAVLRKHGLRAFRDVRIYAAALVALLPPLAWYLWAAHFWWTYGNSLGVSNESHFLCWAMLYPPRFLYGILKWETLGVFTPTGWLLALAALSLPRGSIERPLVWYGALWLLYLVTAGTAGDGWAFYYHSASVAPACLLMGAGVVAFSSGCVPSARRGWLAGRQRWVGGLLAGTTLVALLIATVVLLHKRDSRTDYITMRSCALEFAHIVPPTASIVVHGGAMFDEYGRPVAHNESMVFAWMDRKGFNYASEELEIETLDSIAARGGRYWMVAHDELRRGNLADLASARYHLVASCDESYYLYDLHRRATDG